MRNVHIPPFSKTARGMLRGCLGLILLSAIALLLSYLEARKTSPVLANLNYPPMLEYIFAAIAITACGVLLLAYVEREAKSS